MRVIGKRISNMEPEKNLGQTVQSTKANILMAKSMAMVISSGPMEAITAGTSKITTSRAMASTCGLMGAHSRECGTITRCMVMELSIGLMAVHTRATTLTTKKKDSELSLGQTDESMLASGKMENSMAKEHTLLLMVK